MSHPIPHTFVVPDDIVAIGRYFGVGPDHVTINSIAHEVHVGRPGYEVNLETVMPPRIPDEVHRYDIGAYGLTGRTLDRLDDLTVYHLRVFIPEDTYDRIIGRKP